MPTDTPQATVRHVPQYAGHGRYRMCVVEGTVAAEQAEQDEDSEDGDSHSPKEALWRGLQEFAAVTQSALTPLGTDCAEGGIRYHFAVQYNGIAFVAMTQQPEQVPILAAVRSRADSASISEELLGGERDIVWHDTVLYGLPDGSIQVPFCSRYRAAMTSVPGELLTHEDVRELLLQVAPTLVHHIGYH